MFKRILTATIFMTIISLPSGVLAQADPFKDVCKRAPGNPSACIDKNQVNNTPAGNPIYGPNGIIAKVVNIVTLLVGIAAVISIIGAGLKFITSGNNSQEINQARELVLYAVVGVVLAAMAQLIIRFILPNIAT
jgi:hypothetical protein